MSQSSIDHFDSASSPQVQRDITRVLSTLPAFSHIPLIQRQCYRQQRFSNECGLFTIFFGIFISRHPSATSIGCGVLSLHFLRTLEPTAITPSIISYISQHIESTLPAPYGTDPTHVKDHNDVGDPPYAPSCNREDLPGEPGLEGNRVYGGADTPTSTPMSSAQIRQAITALALHSHIGVTFLYGGETGFWVGELIRFPSAGLPARVRYYSELCGTCNVLRQMPEITLDIPASGVSYIDVFPHTPLSAGACGCGIVNGVHQISPYLDTFSDCGSDDSDFDVDIEDVIATHVSSTNVTAPDTPSSLPQAPVPAETPTPNDFTPLIELSSAPPEDIRGDALANYHIFGGKPPHVHYLSWNRISAATHQARRRWLLIIQNMDPALRKSPLPSAIIETVTRLAVARHWRPATTSRALSDITSALRSLPLYSNTPFYVDLRKSPLYSEALRRAQSIASSTIPRPITPLLDCAPLLDDFTRPFSRALLCLAFASAGRLGDTRQIRPPDISFHDEDAASVLVRIAYKRGKGFAFWGPYSIAFIMDRSSAQCVLACINPQQPDVNIWSDADQRQVTSVLKKRGFEARSIRRGRLTSLARSGMAEEDILALSGHRKVATLRRYLGFEAPNVDAAARRISRATPVHPPAPLTDDSEDPLISSDSDEDVGGEAGGVTRAPIMGAFANLRVHSGQRFTAPPEFFPKRIPGSQALGISNGLVDAAAPLHVKAIVPLSFEALTVIIPAFCSNDHVIQAYTQGLRFLHDVSLYEALSPQPKHPRAIPITRDFSNSDLDTLLNIGKIRIFEDEPRGSCKAFWVPHKGKRRPIFEPDTNASIKASGLAPRVHYASRLSRRLEHTLSACYDFSTFYDQFALDNKVQAYFTFRAPYQGKVQTFALTRLPMGATASASVAQLTTWCITHDLGCADLSIHTMIDNVRFAGNDRISILRATTEFRSRCHSAGLTLNDDPPFSGFDLEGPPQYTFLGEVYTLAAQGRGTVQNSEKFLTKLSSAHEHVRSKNCTFRNFASLVGLLLFGMHTIDCSIATCFALMRTYRALFKCVTDWDATMDFISPLALADIDRIVPQLALAVPMLPTPPPFTPFDQVIFVDASLTGWGAIVSAENGSAATFDQLFPLTKRRVTRFSAYAEPLGVYNILTHLKSSGRLGTTIACFTDHEAIVKGQRDPETGYGGFSPNLYLNGLFKFVDDLRKGGVLVYFKYIKGETNPADVLSRNAGSFAVTSNERPSLILPPWPAPDSHAPARSDFPKALSPGAGAPHHAFC